MIFLFLYMPRINRKGINTKVKQSKISTNKSSYAKYYNSQIWKNLRESYYKEHPICEVCEAHGRINPTEHIHHIQNFMLGRTEEQKWKLLGDPHNCLACCVKCHSAIHQKIDNNNIQTGCSTLTDEEYNKAHQL